MSHQGEKAKYSAFVSEKVTKFMWMLLNGALNDAVACAKLLYFDFYDFADDISTFSHQTMSQRWLIFKS